MKVRAVYAGTVLITALFLFFALLVFAYGKRLGKEPVYEGKPLSVWLENIEERDLVTRDASANAKESTKAVKAMGPKTIPFLLRNIRPPWSTSMAPSEAVEALKALGPQAREAIPELAKMLKEYGGPGVQHSLKDYTVASSAADALAGLGPDALPVLLQAARDLEGRHEQWEIILRLGHFGTNAAPAIPELLRWCRDKDEWVRLGAVNALGEIGLEPETVVPVLRGLLRDPDPLVRRDAADALSQFPESGKTSVDDLIQALQDPDWQTQTGAIEGLGKLGQQKETVLPLIIAKLNDQNRIVRRVAAFALGNLGGKEAFEALLLATDDPDGFVREAVFQSLNKIDPEALKKSGKTFRGSGPNRK